MSTLTAGVGRSISSPPLGTFLAGYANPFRVCKRVRDPLNVTVLVLDDSQGRVALVTADLLAVHEEIAARLRNAVADAAKLNPESVLVACSHSHCAPVASVNEAANAAQHAYVDKLINWTKEAATSAVTSMHPVTLTAGRGQATIAVNRREMRPNGKVVIGVNPDGPCDQELIAVQLTRGEGQVLATLINYACHPTTISPRHRFATAAWPGAMREIVEPETGAPVLFLQGATADLNPTHPWGRGEVEAMARLGREVGQEVLNLLPSLRPMSGAPVRVAREEVQLPLVAEMASDGRTPLDALGALKQQTHVPKWLIQYLLDRCYPWTPRVRDGEGSAKFVPLCVQAMRIGDIGLVGWGAEVFTELGLEVKEASPASMTLFVGYCDGMIGYVTTEQAHSEGGYEVEMSPYLYRFPGKFDASSARRATETSGKLLRALFDSA